MLFGILLWFKHAKTDTDTQIITTALHVAESSEVPVVVIGIDMDLLDMPVARTTPSSNIHYICNISPRQATSIQSCAQKAGLWWPVGYIHKVWNYPRSVDNRRALSLGCMKQASSNNCMNTATLHSKGQLVEDMSVLHFSWKTYFQLVV